MEQKVNLLDLLNDMVGCEYLSAMKEIRWRRKLLQSLNEVDVNEYTFEQWSTALSYLFEEDICVFSAANLQSFIERKLLEIQD